ncbi:MAG: tetratricopeptide repeat protein [Ruminococcus sp.]|nr:tetratricopeptide repeat protein [Ruminococcus sp.]
MDIEAYKEAIANADVAFANARYEQAVKWYDKALALAPDDTYALSKAGTSMVSLNRFDEAFGYFNRAVDADPQNGDNVFNLANAYFFSGDIPMAMEKYTAAELLPCSDDVKARIYYQLALMCSIKQDYRAALINYQKYEDADKTGKASLDTDVISERVNLYIQLQDYDNALKYTLKWLNLAPADIRCYIVYFNLLTATGQYEKAEKVLDDAEKFAVTDADTEYAVNVSRANLYANAAGTAFDKNGDCNQKAYDLMNELIVSPAGTQESKNELVLGLGELCIAMGKVDEAIDLMQMLTEEPEAEAAPSAPVPDAAPVDPAEIDAMLSDDLARMDAMVSSGEISADIGSDAPVHFDENGVPVREYPSGVFGEEDGYALPDFKGVDMEQLTAAQREAEAAEQAAFRARVNYTLLTCYAFREDFENTLKYARLVKLTPDNTYYAFFGRYSEAFAIRQLAKQGKGFTMEQADRKYSEELAFFRSEMLKANEDSAYALLFRTRMYAETGKYAKAEELAELMADDDKAALLGYVEACRKENG